MIQYLNFLLQLLQIILIFYIDIVVIILIEFIIYNNDWKKAECHDMFVFYSLWHNSLKGENKMNIIEFESQVIVEAKLCGCINNKKSVSYHFIDCVHSLCLGKREIILAQIQACEKLLKYIKDDVEMDVIKKEITELKLALDLLHY